MVQVPRRREGRPWTFATSTWTPSWALRADLRPAETMTGPVLQSSPIRPARRSTVPLLPQTSATRCSTSNGESSASNDNWRRSATSARGFPSFWCNLGRTCWRDSRAASSVSPRSRPRGQVPRHDWATSPPFSSSGTAGSGARWRSSSPYGRTRQGTMADRVRTSTQRRWASPLSVARRTC